jgi:hypothetical protein
MTPAGIPPLVEGRNSRCNSEKHRYGVDGYRQGFNRNQGGIPPVGEKAEAFGSGWGFLRFTHRNDGRRPSLE